MSTGLLVIHATHWLAAILLFSVSVYCLRIQRGPMVLALVCFCALAGLWALCSALIFSTTDLSTKIFINRIKLIAPVTLPLSILAMAMITYGKKVWSKYVWFGLSIVPAVSLALLLSDHERVIGDYHLVSLGRHDLLAFANGPWFSVHNFNARSIALVTIVLLILAARDFSPVHRYRVWLIVLAVAIPFLGDSIAVHFAPSLRYMQTTPTLLLISALLMIYAIAGKHLVDVVPFARGHIIESLGDLYLVFNSKGELVDLNAKAKAILKLTERDIGLGQSLLKKRHVIIADLLDSERDMDFEWVLCDTIYEVRQHNLEVPGTDRIGSVISCKDVTLRKRQERSLQSLNDMKTKLLAVLGHDFQGNLATMLIISQNLVQNSKFMRDEEISLSLINLERTASQNILLVEELLDWAKQSLGGSARSQLVDLVGLAESTHKFLKPLAQDHRVILNFEITGNNFVMSDSFSISVILRNLVTNAIKASSEGAKVQVVMQTSDARLTLSVQDHGVGMDHVQISEIFKLKRDRDAGIGLFLSKEFASILGGTISVESEVGRGSEFFVSIPLDSRVSPELFRA